MPSKVEAELVYSELKEVGVSAFGAGLMRLMTQCAWAAGLFEGEGCFTPFKSTHLPRKSDGGISYIIYPHVQITMCDLDVLQQFQRIVGVGSLHGPHTKAKRDGSPRKPTYHWYALNKDAVKVIDMLRPFMCQRRLGQLDAALAKCGRFDTSQEQ